MRRWNKLSAGYAVVLLGCLVLALVSGWTAFGAIIDNDAYDFLFRLHPPRPWPLEAVMLSVDEASLVQGGGMRHIRGMLAQALDRLAAAQPKVVALDVILADEGDPSEDSQLEAAFRKTRNLVLPCDLSGNAWEDPLPRFRRWAVAVGHVYADQDRLDNVSRRVLIEQIADHQRRWSLSFEAFRASKGMPRPLELPGEVQIAGITIPAPRIGDAARSMLIRYLPPDENGRSPIPSVTVAEFLENPSLAGRFRGKVAFVGITALSAARDRLMTPFSFGRRMPGLEVHADAFETIHSGRFLTSAPPVAAVLFSVLLVTSAGFVFAFLSGWLAYGAGALILATAHLAPYLLFRADVVFPYSGALAAAWLSVAAAATYQHFIVRRQLRRSEDEKARYQQAIHFVTHEMRTPLTAIQGSSELMGRYKLTEEKRKQIADMINSESKRLARMIQTFLDVERLSEGEMELRQERFAVPECVSACIQRARPLAERKQIRIELENLPEATIRGDRELMEYAFYNLLTNAVKYSPAETLVRVGGRQDAGEIRISIADEGIGMDEKELKSIFHKFYRTRRAEASGEVGTGIGLSIVQQIVIHHRGRIEVTSRPGHGSCFTVVLPAVVTAPAG